MVDLLPINAGRVVIHGDFSFDNVPLDESGLVTGIIDVRRLGVAVPYQVRAVLWKCLEEFGAELQQELLTSYGISSSDERRLSFQLCLDECF